MSRGTIDRPVDRLDAPASGASRAIFTVFAGRRRYLSVLMLYVRPLLESGLLHRVDLWDYCRLPPDREYLHTLGQAGSARLRVITPPSSDAAAKFPNKWKGYYAYYARPGELAPDDLLVKCDDDIVFIGGLHALLAYARRDAGAHLLYYPSIVNNDVAASFQAADGLITDAEYVVGLKHSRQDGWYSRQPISDWYNCTPCATHVHAAFLARPHSFCAATHHARTRGSNPRARARRALGVPAQGVSPQRAGPISARPPIARNPSPLARSHRLPPLVEHGLPCPHKPLRHARRTRRGALRRIRPRGVIHTRYPPLAYHTPPPPPTPPLCPARFIDEPYLTALLTERTSLPSVIVSDAVAVHFSFGCNPGTHAS